jgi:hypothetical protein
MQNRYYLYQRRSSGVYFIQDRLAKKHESLRTRTALSSRTPFQCPEPGRRAAHPECFAGQGYLVGLSPELANRTWQDVMHAMEKNYKDETLCRFRKLMRSAPLASLLKLTLVYTNSSHFLAVLHHPKRGHLDQQMATDHP